jgi:hypothetical protein
MGTVVQPAGGGNTPAFKANRSGNQAISAGVGTTIQFNLEDEDTDNCYDHTTYKFTPNVAGWYRVSAKIGLSIGTGNYAWFYLNASTGTTTIGKQGGASGKETFACDDLIYFNGSTDNVYASIYIQGTTGNVSGGASGNKFSAFLVVPD